MVKVENEYGDVLTGKSGNAIYQKFYGQQIRRKAYKQTKPPSKAQQNIRQKFKDALAWIKTLTYEQKNALKTYYRNSKLSYDPNYPVNWYNFAKLIYIKNPTFEILNESNNQYRITHPAIKKIEEKSSTGVTLYIIDDLSSFEDEQYTESYNHIPVIGTTQIILTTLSGLQFSYLEGEITTELIYCDISYCDPNYCM